MSLIKANAVQIGQSNTATQNFTLAVPSSPDGTIKLARGNAGATTQDVINVSNTGVVSFPQGFNLTGNVTGNLTGDVFASNGTSKVLENGTNGTNATFTGSVSGGTLSGNASSATALATGSSTARSLENRFADVVNVKDFGAVGNYYLPNGSVNPTPTNDTPAIQAAIDSLGIGGGTVLIPNSMVCLIDTALTIKPHVSLVGPNEFIGSASNNTWNNYNEVKGTLIVNPAITITMQGGSSINKLLIYRKGMTFPAASSLYSGTAITATGDDVSVTHSMILGFNTAFTSNGEQRIKFNYVYLDNTNGINIEACFDISYIENVHAWPFAGVAIGDVKRSGTAFKFSSGGDWNKITNCFSYGYLKGVWIEDCDDVTISGCGADNVNDGLGATHGFFITGNCRNTKIVNCQSGAQATSGVYINTTANLTTIISNHSSWGNTSHGVLVDSGDAIITNLLTGVGIDRAITTTNANSKIIASNIDANVDTIPIFSTVSTENIQIDNLKTSFSSNPVSSLINVKTVTSSGGILQLPSYGEVFYINGTGFEFLQHGWAGRRVTLVFSANLTLTTTGAVATNRMRLASGANFNGLISQSITLVHTGLWWYEASRTL